VTVSAAAATALRPGTRTAPPAVALLPALMLVAIALTTSALAFLTNDLGGFLATVLFGGLLMAACVAPLRVPLLIAMFVGLAVDRPGDAQSRWESPFITIGGLLFQNLNKVIDVEALKFSGVFLLLACLLVVRSGRVFSGRVHDTRGCVTVAPPLRWGMVLALVTIAFYAAYGWLRGGDIQMAKVQVQGFLQLLAAAYLFGVSLRPSRDYRTAGRVVVAAACVKALMAIWIRLTLPSAFEDPSGGLTQMEYATSHGDSLLFACAIAVLIAPLLYRPPVRHLRWVLLTLPLIVAGLVANDRRIAWVQIGIVLIAAVGLNVGRTSARKVVKGAVWLSPLVVPYILVGWWLPYRVFTPVHFVRNLVVDTRPDGSIDRSTLYRDAENYNLVFTFRSHPLMGTGFGHPFSRPAALDDISRSFKEFAYLPHNSLLGLWAFTGALGFLGILSPIVVALFLAARAHAMAREPASKIAATVSVGCIGAYILHLWGDIGFTEAHTIFLIGLAIAIAGQLAADTGAWTLRRTSRAIG
jgi:hypothetical protein